MSSDHIRNFCIIAHIDHGKSTIADRMMELTGTVSAREMKSQLLDSMDLEREKGITIKLAPVQMHWRGYELNLIDTPGHVDFSYEVSRSLQAVETAVLVVDATQGIQAQTLANVYLALEQDLYIIPVINKIDLPAADVDRVKSQLINLLGCSPDEIIAVSAKTGLNINLILDRLVTAAPAPRTLDSKPPAPTAKPQSATSPTRALIFDSYFDDYRGVVLYVRVFSGAIPKSSPIRMLAAASDGLALEVGALTPKMSPRSELSAGQIGYIVTNLKTTREAKVGDNERNGHAAKRLKTGTIGEVKVVMPMSRGILHIARTHRVVPLWRPFFRRGQNHSETARCSYHRAALMVMKMKQHSSANSIARTAIRLLIGILLFLAC